MDMHKLIDDHNYREIEKMLINGFNPIQKSLFQRESAFEYSLRTMSYSTAFAMFKKVPLYDGLRAFNTYDQDLIFLENSSQLRDHIVNMAIDLLGKNRELKDIYAICVEYRYEYASVIIGFNTETTFKTNLIEYQNKYPGDYDEKPQIDELKFNPGDFPFKFKMSKTLFVNITEKEFVNAIANACELVSNEININRPRMDPNQIKVYFCDFD